MGLERELSAQLIRIKKPSEKQSFITLSQRETVDVTRAAHCRRWFGGVPNRTRPEKVFKKKNNSFDLYTKNMHLAYGTTVTKHEK